VEKFGSEIQDKHFGSATLRPVGYTVKLRQPTGRKDSLQAVCRKIRGLAEFMYFAAQNFELFTKIQEKKK
jgi:hypothetical protein